MNYRYLVSFKIIRDTQPPHRLYSTIPTLQSALPTNKSATWKGENLLKNRSNDSEDDSPAAPTHSVLRVRVVRGLADVPAHLLKDASGFVQGLGVKQRLPIKVQRILLVVEAERESQDDVQSGRIVVVAARVPVERLLVQLAAVRLGA